MITFVWINGLVGLEPQLWCDGQVKPTPLFKYELTKEECAAFDMGFLKLDDFILRFKRPSGHNDVDL